MIRYYSKALAILFVVLFQATYTLLAQADLKLQEPKRFIDKIEVFAGPSQSFNYGDKFVENYNDENVTNERLQKLGYMFGIGVYHPISKRFDLNVRLQYEQKGTRNKLNTPSFTGSRIINIDDYWYKYLTIQAMPQLALGKSKNVILSFGLYYSRIKEIKGSSKLWYTNGTTSTEGSFEGRYFYDLSDDGIRQGFAWMPNFTSMENDDFGLGLSAGYKVSLKDKHSILIQFQDNFGIQNINKNNPYELEETNHSVILVIDYIFKLPIKK